MSDAQEMERFFRERGFGQLIGWGDSPALLVIDFTRAFCPSARIWTGSWRKLCGC
jgi:hypothetical protein